MLQCNNYATFCNICAIPPKNTASTQKGTKKSTGALVSRYCTGYRT